MDDPPPTPLSALCVIRGCICLKEGNNLCPTHQHPDTPKGQRCHQI